MAPSSKATAKPAKKAQKAAAAPSAKTSAKSAGRSAERITDSDLESDSESESADEKASSGTSSSGEEESGESGSGSGTSSSGSDSDSESESDSDAADLPAEVPVSKKTTNPKFAPIKPTTSAPPAPFAPPKGFTPLPPTASAPLAATVFSAAHLAGKQIWHITAPASLPLHALTTVSLPAVLAGQPVLSHRGADYGFIRDDRSSGGSDTAPTHILVPAAAGRKRGWPAYAACDRKVDQTLHLQQLVELPGLVAGAQERATVPAKARAARMQPAGLRMRFRPIGFGEGGTGEIGEEESEVEEAEPVFKKHKAVAGGEEGEKKKKQKKEKGERSEKSEKKRKEKRAAAA